MNFLCIMYLIVLDVVKSLFRSILPAIVFDVAAAAGCLTYP